MRLRKGIGYATTTAAVLLLVLISSPHTGAADGADSNDGGTPGVPEFHYDTSAYGDRWILGDQNEDGQTDYALYVDEDNYKVREAVDYNNDGQMDDFYYYENEVLQKQEVDTNFDQEIDLWVYMHRGVWVERYERDTNYDGEPDVVKNFDSRDQQAAGQQAAE